MGGLGRGARVSDFFTQNPNLKKKKWGEGDGEGVDRWAYRRTGPNRLPLQLTMNKSCGPDKVNL